MKRILCLFAASFAGALCAVVILEMPPTVRAGSDAGPTQNGDVNDDGERDISDAVYILNWLFSGGAEPVAIAQGEGGLTQEQAELLSHLSLVQLPDGKGGLVKTIRFTGVNVQIVNGLGATNGFTTENQNPPPAGPAPAVNGAGNLLIGYQEVSSPETTDRTGSHNLVVGVGNNYSSVGCVVFGYGNTVNGQYATITGGIANAAGGPHSNVTGGHLNTASGRLSCVGGGEVNEAAGELSSVGGGNANSATGLRASVSGGNGNIARGSESSVCGGSLNEAIGVRSAVHGGQFNKAEGDLSAVSGGLERVAAFGWRAGDLPESQ